MIERYLPLARPVTRIRSEPFCSAVPDGWDVEHAVDVLPFFVLRISMWYCSSVAVVGPAAWATVRHGTGVLFSIVTGDVEPSAIVTFPHFCQNVGSRWSW